MARHAIRFASPGGPEVLEWAEVAVGEPGPGQLRLRQTAVGVNFIDCYHRSGLYPVAALPSGLGMEAAGIVEAVGAGVDGIAAGDRVAYGTGVPGAYAQARIVPAAACVKLPDGVTAATAAAVMLKGLTAWYLLRRVHVVAPGETVLIHAAAGGVGSIAVPWAKALGATVIGTAGGPDKVRRALDLGCDHAIDSRREDLAARVKLITGGAGVRVVYDGVGKDSFHASLACLAPMGLMVSFGNASGPVGPVDPLLLGSGGSLFLTRPRLADYTARLADLQSGAADLFAQIESGAVPITIGQTYPLADAAQAHRDLEGRRTTGSALLIP